nr:probable transmembrane ascorbate ferrireductase 4 [Tanacetum cinerariifolium]
MDSNINNENEPLEFSLDIDDSDLHVTPVVRSSSSTHVEPSPYTPNPVRIIPGPAGIVQQAKMLKEKVFILDSDGALMSTQEYMQKVVEDVGEDDDFKSGAWVSATNYVVAIVKSCSPNALGDLTMTMKDLSGTIPGSIHYKVIGEGCYGKDITVRAAMILTNILVLTPKPSKHYLNITKRNVVKPLAMAAKPTLSLIFVARLLATLVIILVLTWALYFTTSFIPRTLSQRDLIYSVLHPLLMVIGFILISGEAILVHRWLPGSRQSKKRVHLWLQGVALASGIFGIWTKFQGQDGVVANFYSLHSWMGLLCVSLFGAQWLMGFLSFWHRGEVRMTRIRVLPWHVFLGLYTYGLAVVTAETGLLEKLTFLQTKGVVLKRCSESMIVNGLGLGLAMLCGLVILTAVSPKQYQSIPTTKVVYSDSKCLTS